MAGKQRFAVIEVIEAIRKGHTPAMAAGLLKCNADTVRNYADRYPTVKAALLSERKAIVDYAENGLYGAVINREPWAIAFALKTLAKDIYTERHEVTGKDGGALEVIERIVTKRDDTDSH